MEENRPKVTKENVAKTDIKKDNENLKKELEGMQKALSEMYNRCKELENTWAFTRANYLLKIVENSTKFTPSIVKRAIKEFEVFMFPPELEDNKKEAE